MGMQVARWLRSFATRSPDLTALVLADDADREVSYAELDALACSVAGALLERGIEPNDRVALLGGNSVDFVAAAIGALYAGIAIVPIPVASSVPEIRDRIERSGARLLVHDEARERLADSATSSMTTPRVLASELRAAPIDGPSDRPADATAMLLFTSGTTGESRAARIGHASLVAHTSAIIHHALRLDSSDVVLGTLPLTHSYGARIALFGPLFAGARTVLVDRFEPERVARALARHRVTFFPGVPTMFSALARLERRIDAPSLRWCLSAGASLPEAVRLRAEACLGAPIREGYGLTEATFSTIDTPDDPDGAGTVGRPVPGVEVRVVDESGRALVSGEIGEVVVRGQNRMLGYLDDPVEPIGRATEWLRTGDLGVLDHAGRLRIVDRKKDLIVRGGFNVVPAEVEAALVADTSVAEALVVGIPDEHYGEEIVAVVVPREPTLDIAALGRYLRETLAATKRPRRIAIVSELPVGGSGKALRRVVRDRLVAGVLTTTPI